jgi:esterase/lipase superfamily enzyme
MQIAAAMQRQYEKWFSSALGREMELLRFGWSGFPVIAFPTSMGRFFQYEDMGTIGVLSGKIEAGEMQIFCVDSVDAESWYADDKHPAQRAPRQEQYDAYLRYEVVPYVWDRAQRGDIGLYGCSFGGYHVANFAGRHPEIVVKALSLSGVYDVHRFTDGYWDDTDYYNSPVDFIANMDGGWVERLRHVEWINATGEYDALAPDNRRLDAVLSAKGIPHRTEIWPGVNGHDWPFWNEAVLRLL